MIKRYCSVLLMVTFLAAFTACGKASAGGIGENVNQNQQSQAESQQMAKAEEGSSASGQAGETKPAEPAESAELTKPEEQTSGSKAVVVYFSATGTTAKVAQCIAETTGADILEIVPESVYTAEDLDYHNDNCRANREMNDDTARPAISSDLHTVSGYDVVYLGYPVWWGTAPRIIQTFLESYDLSKAAVYTFCTSGGSGIEKSVQDLQASYPGIKVIGGKRFGSASEADVQAWIDSLE